MDSDIAKNMVRHLMKISIEGLEIRYGFCDSCREQKQLFPLPGVQMEEICRDCLCEVEICSICKQHIGLLITEKGEPICRECDIKCQANAKRI